MFSSPTSPHVSFSSDSCEDLSISSSAEISRLSSRRFLFNRHCYFEPNTQFVPRLNHSASLHSNVRRPCNCVNAINRSFFGGRIKRSATQIVRRGFSTCNSELSDDWYQRSSSAENVSRAKRSDAPHEEQNNHDGNQQYQQQASATDQGIKAASLCAKGLNTIQLSLLNALHADLQNLELLQLTNNMITSLPLSVFVQLPSLRVLDVSRNRLTSFDAKIFEFCPKLEELILDFNQLESLPEPVCQQSNLKVLSCAHNRLVLIPSSIKQFLCGLTVLRINKNHLPCLPHSLGELQSLQILDISDNYFSSVPASMHKLNHLTSLTLDWFRYCSPSLPRHLAIPLESRAIDKFRDICRQFAFRGLSEVDAVLMVQALSTKELNIEAVDRGGRNRLHASISAGHVGVAASLVAAGANIDAHDGDGLSALVLAARECCYEGVKMLVAAGASTTSGGGQLGSALHVAAVNLDVGMCLLLLGSGCDADHQDVDGNTPLHVLMSVYDKDPDKARTIGDLLIEAGADCNELNIDRWSPLHFAARRAQKHAIAYIVNNHVSAPPDCRHSCCSHDRCASLVSMERRRVFQPAARASRLLASRPSLPGKCNDPQCAAFSSLLARSTTATELQRHRASVPNEPTSAPVSINRRSSHQVAPSPVESSSQPSCSRRCPKTFDLDLPGGLNQWTALHLAGHAAQASILMQLVAGGANATLRCRRGKTPSEVSEGSLIVAKLLKAAENEWRTLKTQPKLRKLLNSGTYSPDNAKPVVLLSLPYHSLSFVSAS